MSKTLTEELIQKRLENNGVTVPHETSQEDKILFIKSTFGCQIVTDWEYDANTNSVRFASGHVPEAGQTIDIDYNHDLKFARKKSRGIGGRVSAGQVAWPY